MDPNYHLRQAASYTPFSGPLRQRGRGIGAIAAGALRFAVPLVLPYVSKIGKSFINNISSDISNVVSGKTRARDALKKASLKTLTQQFGGRFMQTRPHPPPRRRRRTTGLKTKASRGNGGVKKRSRSSTKRRYTTHRKKTALKSRSPTRRSTTKRVQKRPRSRSVVIRKKSPAKRSRKDFFADITSY